MGGKGDSRYKHVVVLSILGACAGWQWWTCFELRWLDVENHSGSVVVSLASLTYDVMTRHPLEHLTSSDTRPIQTCGCVVCFGCICWTAVVGMLRISVARHRSSEWWCGRSTGERWGAQGL